MKTRSGALVPDDTDPSLAQEVEDLSDLPPEAQRRVSALLMDMEETRRRALLIRLHPTQVLRELLGSEHLDEGFKMWLASHVDEPVRSSTPVSLAAVHGSTLAPVQYPAPTGGSPFD